jgi:hypothetical protein
MEISSRDFVYILVRRHSRAREARAQNPYPIALAACRIREKQRSALSFVARMAQGHARLWLWIPGLRHRRIPE